MKRTPVRKKEEFEARHGKSYAIVMKELRGTIKLKNTRISHLLDKLGSIKQEHDSEMNQLKILHRRDVRSLSTKLSNLDKKFKEFKEKKGERNRTVFYRNKYKTYEPPKAIRNFEESINRLKDLPEDYIVSFERLMKLNQFIESYNKENQSQLTITHYIVLLNLTFTRGLLQGVTAPKVVIPLTSPHIVRKSLNYLADNSLVTRVSRISFRISLLGDKFLEDAKNYNSYGKSHSVEYIKRITKLIEDVKEEDF